MRYGTTGLVILLMIVSGESIYAQTLVTGGTAYRWWNMSTLTATTNQTAEAGLNDGNVAVDVTLGGDTGAQNYQAAGLIWATNQNITSFSFTQGTTGGDGWWTNAVALQIQSFNGTTWTAISGWSLSPTYPYGPSASGTYTFVGPSISARGIRVVGVVHNIVADSWWAILREVSASYLAPTATPVATLTPTFTPLPATETPTSTAFPPTATSTAIPKNRIIQSFYSMSLNLFIPCFLKAIRIACSKM